MKALQTELENISSVLNLRSVDVYIGGGTPTINQEGILELLDEVHELVRPRSITIEANPATLRNVDFVEELSRKLRDYPSVCSLLVLRSLI